MGWRGGIISVNGNKYEFVPRKNWSPIRADLNRIIQKANSYLIKNTDICFDFRLVGSGNRGLVTRTIGGNQGFDLDFNLILDTPDYFSYKPNKVKQLIMNAFQYAVNNTEWSNPKDSTSVFTIKVVDYERKRVKCSCDFAIIYYDADGEMYYLHNYKDSRGYEFVHRPHAKEIESSINEIRNHYEDGWNLIRNEYLKLKNNNNDPNKKSFILYIEAVNNVYYRMPQKQRRDDYG